MKTLLKNDWQELLAKEFTEPYYKKLQSFLTDEYRTRTIFPKEEDIFSALNHTSYENSKVLILGQDPYHGAGQAHGLSFSVKPGTSTPPSLRNMYKELKTDLNCFIPNNGFLNSWADQGVLLLNAVLTVREAQANSHKNKGWEHFTDKIIALLNEKTDPVVFILWGRNAQQKEKYITNQHHLILKCTHPSPLSASRGFFGCKHFSKTNEFLTKHNLDPINWQIDNI